ncbi:L7Ae/L30e/S12e/Gadd45 family ribosomal protein [Sinanaerobacter chloroacetimidivorans]|jgi:ribosomal protein L7Ae-like RNA K-turn-binding protein|uniref:Ribosomal L7Ae/L30e/S12e/Gadd45 family protein n=1 Tax=Sinanaerobacter chloroacetimidivorans TaxID=2818044 RepID=A0A8J7W014_9FIRM|nr:L7Ae/L30e/S12e/Gadd45 family ribosomal protein [Sinanaerobacter chloroacetimidivorans]MBR0596760.1 ribosomal L7Ae/L30e/S12e/Gadd45 family protein [Sinanaerobacter chloroacetimidivorans]
MRKKIDSYFGFAKKSRNLLSGYHTCTYGIKQGKIKLLILTEDLSENTVKKLAKLSEDHGVPVRIYGKTEELSKITGSQERGVFGITDVNFADVILKELDRE